MRSRWTLPRVNLSARAVKGRQKKPKGLDKVERQWPKNREMRLRKESLDVRESRKAKRRT